MNTTRVLRLGVLALLLGVVLGWTPQVSAGPACLYDPKEDVCIDQGCKASNGECELPVPPSEECFCFLG